MGGWPTLDHRSITGAMAAWEADALVPCTGSRATCAERCEEAHHTFLVIHPFLDGNGRVAGLKCQRMVLGEHALGHGRDDHRAAKRLGEAVTVSPEQAEAILRGDIAALDLQPMAVGTGELAAVQAGFAKLPTLAPGGQG